MLAIAVAGRSAPRSNNDTKCRRIRDRVVALLQHTAAPTTTCGNPCARRIVISVHRSTATTTTDNKNVNLLVGGWKA